MFLRSHCPLDLAVSALDSQLAFGSWQNCSICMTLVFDGVINAHQTIEQDAAAHTHAHAPPPTLYASQLRVRRAVY